MAIDHLQTGMIHQVCYSFLEEGLVFRFTMVWTSLQPLTRIVTALLPLRFSNSFPWLTRDSGNISWDQKWRLAWRLHSSLSINCLSQPKNLCKKNIPGDSGAVTFLGWWVKTWPELNPGMKVGHSLNHLVFDFLQLYWRVFLQLENWSEKLSLSTISVAGSGNRT